VHRVDPQLDLVGARRVPVIPKRNPQPNWSWTRTKSSESKNRGHELGHARPREEYRTRCTWTEAARSRTSGSPSRAGEQVCVLLEGVASGLVVRIQRRRKGITGRGRRRRQVRWR
jgi:hypothetical protein